VLTISSDDVYVANQSSQVPFIYIVFFTIHIESNQLHSDNMKIIQQNKPM